MGSRPLFNTQFGKNVEVTVPFLGLNLPIDSNIPHQGATCSAIRKSNNHYSPLFMIRNYFLTGFRNLVKYRFYSIINVAGLGLGIAASLLLVSWIIHELSYDRFLIDEEIFFG
jgi:hypothetical protein